MNKNENEPSRIRKNNPWEKAESRKIDFFFLLESVWKDPVVPGSWDLEKPSG